MLHGNNTDGFYRMGKLTDVYSNAELFKAYPELMLDNLREYMRDRDTAQSEYLKIKNRSPGELYKATAGEIEARDTAKRANLTAGERKNTRPDIDRTDVVFANNSSESMEIVTLDNGKQYVHASEQQVIEGNNSQLWKQQIARYINKELRNWNDFDILTVEGDVLTLTKNTAYKAGSVNQVRNQDGTYRAMTQAEYLTKLNAEVHINELAQISKKIKRPNVPDSKNHSFAKNGFSYRTAYFQDYDGEYYKITLSVGENGNISTVYNVGKLKKDTLPNGTIKSVFSGSKADSVSNGITVTQKSPSVNSILSENPKKITTETKNTAENSGVKRQNKISVEMNDAERAEVLRNSAIDIVKYKGNVEDLNAANVLALQETYRANAAPVLKKLAEKFGVFDKTYFNKNISLDFSYSRGSLKESVNKQGKVSTDFYDFAKMLYVFDYVVNNAVPIEAHTDKYAGTERANQNLKYDYVLLSAFSDGNYIIPVEMHIKEQKENVKQPNTLYVGITLGKIKTEDGILAHPSKRKNVSANVTPPSSKINVAQLISKVNPGFSDFYKYIPSELLTEAQISSKMVALDDEKYRLGVLRGEDVSGMLRKKAEKAGYSPDDSWKMDHRAPNADDDTAHNMAEIDAAYGGDGSIYSAQAAYYYGEGRSYDRNAIRVIQSARNNPDKQITVYRAVPADLKETRLRNGDWVAIVKQYAIEHGNRVLDGNFKIIEMTVPAKYLYGNGDSINE